MNNIRRDEIDKIKRRRKRKSNKLLGGSNSSKALLEFNKHIEAAQSDIEKSRLRYCNVANNQNVNRKKTKLTMGIFDNAVCSRNIQNILQSSVCNKELAIFYEDNLFKLPIVNQKLENKKGVDNKDLKVNEMLDELADECSKQLNIDEQWVSNTAGMVRLRAAKADAHRNNRLALIDCHKQIGSPLAGRVSESNSKLKEKKESHERQGQPSLSASTSISNRRISFLPRRERAADCANTNRPQFGADCQATHPLWDTPEELRTSHPSAFSDRSLLVDETLPLLTNHTELSRFPANLWMKE